MAASSSDVGGQDIDWASITAKLPTGRDTASALRRAELFNRFDVNQNGVLSLAEVDKATRDVLGLDSMFSSKAVLMRAFNAARDVNAKKRPKQKRKDDYVERDEFRLLLVYLRQYFELYVAFNRLDTNSDRRLDQAEFRNSLETLAKWGIKLSPDQAEAEFKSIDANGGGAILFDEFCFWAISKNLDIEDDDDFEDDAGIGFKSAAEGAGHLLNKSRAAAAKVKEVAQPTGWRGQLAMQRASANMVHAKIVSASKKREEAAREKLIRLRAQAQRELTRAAALTAHEKQKERRREEVARVRAETDQLIGRDVTARVRDVPALTDEEVHQYSALFNDALMQNKNDKQARSFFKLFKDLDIDGSRRIAFSELERMVRGKLHVEEKTLPLDKLYGLWKVLDENSSGFIDAGELSRFLRIGAPKTLTAVERARINLQQAREERMARIRADTQKLQEKGIIDRAAGVERASDEDVARFGELFHKQLSVLRPRGQDNISFYGLFKQMDVDESGKVNFDEFKRMIRRGLNLDSKQMPLQTVLGLWKAIDENGNGFICAGEFGRFMRTASEGPNRVAQDQQTANGELQMKRQEDAAHEQLKREEIWARNTASSANAAAQALEAEAARLEALLGTVKSHGIVESTSSMLGSRKSLVGSRSSASLVRAAGRAEIGEGPGAAAPDVSSPEASPTKRMEVIQLLTREMKQGGGRTRVKANVGSLSVPMLLPSIAKEEGNL